MFSLYKVKTPSWRNWYCSLVLLRHSYCYIWKNSTQTVTLCFQLIFVFLLVTLLVTNQEDLKRHILPFACNTQCYDIKMQSDWKQTFLIFRQTAIPLAYFLKYFAKNCGFMKFDWFQQTGTRSDRRNIILWSVFHKDLNEKHGLGRVNEVSVIHNGIFRSNFSLSTLFSLGNILHFIEGFSLQLY